MCSPSSSVVSDSEIGDAVESWAGSNAEAVRDWLKANGKWSPSQYSYSPATQTIKSDPVTKTETVTAPNGQPQTATQQTRKVTNITCTADGCAITAGEEVTRTNPDGSTEVSTSTAPQANSSTAPGPSPNPSETPEIPDDYAREATLEAIREALANRQATAGDRACTQPPACSGDAILCAIVTQVWRQSCQWQESQPDGEPGEPDEVDVDDLVGSLSRTRWSAPATCPADITFQSMAGQITIPMQYACDQAAILRPFVIGAALLAAAFIVMGARS